MFLRGKFVVSEITKKSKSVFFKQLVVGDELEMDLELKPVGRYAGDTGPSYAVPIRIRCVRTNDYTYKTVNELALIFRIFKLQQVE